MGNHDYTISVDEKTDSGKDNIQEQFGKAPSLDEATDDSALNPKNDQEALQDIDQMLAEEDPQFFQQISEIQVESAEGDLSIMDDVLGGFKKRKKKSIKWRFHFENLFFIKNDPKKVIMFWSLVSLSVIAIIGAPQLSELYFSKGLFLRSYAEWHSDVVAYNPISEAEPFYDNPRFAKNLVTMTKMVTNLKPSENSGPNPMIAVELSVEGMSAEAIIEIKDREAEFKDILLRKAEEFTYDDLSSADGKKKLLEKFTDVINANLSQGQVRRTMLKSFITKP